MTWSNGLKKWSKEQPKVEGWYLRANPPCPGFQKHYLQILEVDCPDVKMGELGISFPKGEAGRMMRVSDLPSFYWFGPIPKIPNDILEIGLKKEPTLIKGKSPRDFSGKES